MTSFFYGLESEPKDNVNGGFHRKSIIEQQSQKIPTYYLIFEVKMNESCLCVGLALLVLNDTKSRRCLPSVIWSFSASFKGRLASQSQCVHCERKSDRRRIVWKGRRRKSEKKWGALFTVTEQSPVLRVAHGWWVTRPHIKDMELLLFCVCTKCRSREGGAPCH